MKIARMRWKNVSFVNVTNDDSVLELLDIGVHETSMSDMWSVSEIVVLHSPFYFSYLIIRFSFLFILFLFPILLFFRCWLSLSFPYLCFHSFFRFLLPVITSLIFLISFPLFTNPCTINLSFILWIHLARILQSACLRLYF